MTETPRGLKLDDGKLAFHLQDDDAEAEMVAVLTFGAVKYEPGNWAHVEDAEERYYAAARRHLRSSRGGEILDPETGLLALAGAACSIHFLLALALRKRPDLVSTLPQRLAESVRRARELRAKRLAAADAAGMSDLAPLASPGWEWALVSARGRSLRVGTEATREEALAAAKRFQARGRVRSAKVLLSERQPPQAWEEVPPEASRRSAKKARPKKSARRR